MAKDKIVRSQISEAIDGHAEGSLRKGIIEQTAKFSPEELDTLARAAGVDSLSSEGVADIVLGQGEGLGLGQIRENLLADGTAESYTLAGKIMGVRRGLSGQTVKVTIGGETEEMKLTDAIRMKESLDIKDTVTKKVNDMRGLFNELSDVPLDETAEKALTNIAINEAISGKDSTVTNKYRHNSMRFLTESKQKFQLSEELENSLTADIVEGSGKLASAIDFSKQFATMDDSIRQAGNEMAALEFYIQGAAAQKKLRESFNSDNILKVTTVTGVS
tara:strand:- start:104 stop:928 length:825 start_codon:yes stop_codon:yes gene_type:complete